MAHLRAAAITSEQGSRHGKAVVAAIGVEFVAVLVLPLPPTETLRIDAAGLGHPLDGLAGSSSITS